MDGNTSVLHKNALSTYGCLNTMFLIGPTFDSNDRSDFASLSLLTPFLLGWMSDCFEYYLSCQVV